MLIIITTTGEQQIKLKFKSNSNSAVFIVDKDGEKSGNLYMLQSKQRSLLAYSAIEWWLCK
jgi:hypothetical protein